MSLSMPQPLSAQPDEAPQWRALTRTFLARFFDHDITGGADDLRLAFIWLLAFLAMPGVVMPILQAWAVYWNGHSVDAGWILTASRQGVDALRVSARADKIFYLGYTGIAAAALAAMSWNSLLLDRRDTLILGTLPIRPRTVIAAKLAALAVYIGALTASMNVLSAVMFGTLLASGNTLSFALRGIAAHAVASCGIGAFVVLAIAALQGVSLLIAGPRRFARVSALLQTSLTAAIGLSLFALPIISGGVNDTLRGTAHAHLWILFTPAAWFLGVYEWMLGGLADPALLALARTAVIALVGAISLVVVSYPLAYRRLVRAGVDAPHTRGLFIGRRIMGALPLLIGPRSPQIRAIAQFLLTTLTRVERHRFVLAAACGLAIAWALPSAMTLGGVLPAAPTSSLYALPFATLLFLTVGLRVALSLPSDLGGGWLFDMAPPPSLSARTAVRRTMMLIGVAPIVAAAATIDTSLWGGAFAVRHAAIVLLTGLLLIEILIRDIDGMPCTSPWRPEAANLRAWWPVYLLAFATFTRGIPAIGFAASRTVLTTALLAIALWTVGAIIRHRSERRFAPPAPARVPDPDEETPPLRDRFRDLVRELPHWPAHAWHDAPFALRRLRAAPVFAVFAVVTLALGIGGTAATYSVLRSVSGAHVGFADADRVLVVTRWGDRSARPASLSWLDYQDLRNAQTAFSGVSAWTSLPSGLSANGRAEIVAVEGVSGGGFEILGVRPALGRSIQPTDDRLDAAPVVVLSDALWRSRFAAASTVIGTSVRIGGRPFEVIGVAPPDFQGVEQQGLQRTSAWIPLAQAPAMFQTIGYHLDLTNRRHDWIRVLGRLAAGASRESASTQVHAISRRLDISAPITGTTRNEGARRWAVDAAATAINDQGSPLLALLCLSLPALVLLIACSNLANLVLSRGAARQHDLAVRQALGASRSRLIREQLLDAMMLAIVGGLGGVLVARGLLIAVAATVLRTFGALPQYRIDASLSTSLIGAAAAAAVLTVVIAGVAPALSLTRNTFRRAFAAGASSAVPRWSGRANVVIAQVAVSTGLLLLASLFVRQLVADFAHPGRAGLDRVGVVMLPLGAQQRDEITGRRTIDRVLIEARQHAELSSVAAVSLAGRDLQTSLGVETSTPDRPFETTTQHRTFADLIIGTPAMFQSLSLSIHFGRGFDDRDTQGAEAVAVIGARLARTLFGRDDVTGMQLIVRGHQRTEVAPDGITTLRIVGITDDWTAGDTPGDHGSVYVPLTQDYASDLAIVAFARSSDGATAATLLQQVIHDADPDVAVGFSGSAALAANQRSRLFGLITTIASSLALLAITLAMAGLYGVLSLLVGRRTREIGVRVALGASTHDVIRMVMLEGLRPVAIGLPVGVGAAALLRLALQPFFQQDIAAIDAVALLLAAAPLAAAASIACYLPARRASRVSPTEALRHT